MGFIKARVAARRFVTSGMVRVTFAGPEIDAFEDTGAPDEFVRAFFPDPETGALPLPEPDEAGRAVFPEGVTPPHNEYYSIRHIDKAARRLDIDFVVHEGGIASDWAQRAEPGDAIVLGKARFCYKRPPDARWQVLMADATGLPALGRILEETPADIDTIAIVEVADPSHCQDLPAGGHIDLRWITGTGNGVGPSALPRSFKSLTLPEAPGYIWMAGELVATRVIRRHLREVLGWTGERFDVVRYWLDKKETWRARWDALDPEARAELDAIWESDMTADEKADLWHNLLEKHGL